MMRAVPTQTSSPVSDVRPTIAAPLSTLVPRMPRLFGLTLGLLTACGEPAAPPAAPPAEPERPAVVAPPLPPSASPEAPAEDEPAPAVLAGDVYWIGDETRAAFLPIDPLPQPDVEVMGQIELHHAHRILRMIDEVPAPSTLVVVDERTPLCEARVTRARRLHTLFVGEGSRGEDEPPNDPRTYLALEFEGCEEGSVGISGVALADVRVRSLRRDALLEHAPAALVEAVRHVDDGMWGGEPLRGDAFRMLDLPAHGVTIVVGTGAWVLREGVVLSGAEPVTLIEAGPLVLFELQTPSEGWLGSLADFAPRYVPGECEVTDDSGTSMNVRAGPRGNATVVTSVPAGTRITANDMSGSWFHLATSPPGWAHQRGLRCDPLQPVAN